MLDSRSISSSSPWPAHSQVLAAQAKVLCSYAKNRQSTRLKWGLRSRDSGCGGDMINIVEGH